VACLAPQIDRAGLLVLIPRQRLACTHAPHHNQIQ
jgi:hypothetical protein